MADTIIARTELCELPGRGTVNLLYFHSGPVLMITAVAAGLYRDRPAVEDPLGNGTLGYESFPGELAPQWEPEHGHVREQLSGYVGLTSGAALFIRPDGVALYPDSQSALRNRNMRWLLPFDHNRRGVADD